MSQVVINDIHLINIADAIRAKNGTEEKYTIDEMSSAIDSITTGSGKYLVTGSCSDRFKGANKLFTTFRDLITYETDGKITYCRNMFEGCADAKSIPFDIVANGDKPIRTDYMFKDCNALEEIPLISSSKYGLYTLEGMFENCHKLKSIPIEKIPIANNNCSYKKFARIFYGCYSLRSFPLSLITPKGGQYNTDGADSYYTNVFTGCYLLDELVGLWFPFPDTNKTHYSSNLFYNAFYYCWRLARLTFSGNGNISRKVTNQTIDLSSRVGYTGISTSNHESDIISYGIPSGKRVTSAATYQELKNDYDWWTSSLTYSRYNKTSAIETINSLPNTAQTLATYGGTNTIKFTGSAGSGTDGGAIQDMTEEEIAVATAKGWTVTMV